MNVVKGAIGIATCLQQYAGLRVNQASEEVRQDRVSKCAACEVSTKNVAGKLTTWSTCSPCGCLIVCKTMIASEQCPLPEPRWKRVEPIPAG